MACPEYIDCIRISCHRRLPTLPITFSDFSRPGTKGGRKVGNTKPIGSGLHCNSEHGEKYREGDGTTSQLIGEEKNLRNDYDGCAQDVPGDGLAQDVPGDGCAQGVLAGGCAKDVQDGGCAQDVLGDGCAQGVLGGRYAQGVQDGGYAQDMKDDGWAQDVPGGRYAHGVRDGGCAQDVPGDGFAQGVPGGRYAQGVLGDGCAQDVFGDGCAQGVSSDGCTQHLPSDECAQDVQDGGCAQDVRGDGCAQGVRDSGCAQDVRGDGYAKGVRDGGCAQDVRGDGCAKNVLGDGCAQDVSAGKCAQDMPSDECTQDVPGDECTQDVLGDGCAQDLASDECTQDVTGDECDSGDETTSSDEGVRDSIFRWPEFDSSFWVICVICGGLHQNSMAYARTMMYRFYEYPRRMFYSFLTGPLMFRLPEIDVFGSLEQRYQIRRRSRYERTYSGDEEVNVKHLHNSHNLFMEMRRERTQCVFPQSSSLSQMDREHPSDSGKILNHRKGPDQEGYKRPAIMRNTCSNNMYQGSSLFRVFFIAFLLSFSSGVEGIPSEDFHSINLCKDEPIKNYVCQLLSTLPFCPPTEELKKVHELCVVKLTGQICSARQFYHRGEDVNSSILIGACWEHIGGSPGLIPLTLYDKEEQASKPGVFFWQIYCLLRDFAEACILLCTLFNWLITSWVIITIYKQEIKERGIKPNSHKTTSAKKGIGVDDRPIREASQHEDTIVLALNQSNSERNRDALKLGNIIREPTESVFLEEDTDPKMIEINSREVGNVSFRRSNEQNTGTDNENISLANIKLYLKCANSLGSKWNGGSGRSMKTTEGKPLSPLARFDKHKSSDSSCKVNFVETTSGFDQSKGFRVLDWPDSDNHQTHESSLNCYHVGFVAEEGLIPASEDINLLKLQPENNPDDEQNISLKSDCFSGKYYSSGYPIETDLSMEHTSNEISSHTTSDSFRKSAHYKAKMNVVHGKKSTVQVTDVHDLIELSEEEEEETELKYRIPSTKHTDETNILDWEVPCLSDPVLKPIKYNTVDKKLLDKQKLAQPIKTEELDASITLVGYGAQKAEKSILDDEKMQENHFNAVTDNNDLESLSKSIINLPKHDNKTRFDSSLTSGYETENLSTGNTKAWDRDSEIAITDNHCNGYALDCGEEEKSQDNQSCLSKDQHAEHADARLCTNHNKLYIADSSDSLSDEHLMQTLIGHEHLRDEADKSIEDKDESEKGMNVKEINGLYRQDTKNHLKVQAMARKGRKIKILVSQQKQQYKLNDPSMELIIRSIAQKYENGKKKRKTKKSTKRKMFCKKCRRKLCFENQKCLSCNRAEFKTRPEGTATSPDCDDAPSFLQKVSTLHSSLLSLKFRRSDILRNLLDKLQEYDLNRDKLVEEVKKAEDEVIGGLDSIMREFRSPRFINNLRSFVPEVTTLETFPVLRDYFERLEQGPISHEESMTYEWLRLASLNSYGGAASAIVLARNGFYHDVEQGPTATRCHACKLLKTNWEFFDNIEEEHRRLSPNCPLHQAGTPGNVSIDNQSERNAPEVTEEEPVERNSTPEVIESSEHTRNEVNSITENLQGTQIRDMTPEGFPQQPTEDRYNHEFTSRSSPRTVSGHEPSRGPPEGTGRAYQQHTGAGVGARDSNNMAPNITVTTENSTISTQRPRTQVAASTPFVTGAGKLRERNQGNGGFSTGFNDPSRVNVLDPKHGEYASVDSRTASFTAMWPSYLDQTPRQMAEAGFFYAGVADFTRCFACGGGLRNWEAGDDPCLEHTRWYPRCEYMNKLKGPIYVQAVVRRQEEHVAEQRRRQQQQQQQRRQQTPSNMPPDPLTTPAAAVLIEMGYTGERVREAILAVRRNTGHKSVSAEQALIWILDQDETAELTTSAPAAPTVTQPTVTTTYQRSAPASSQTSTSTQVSSATSTQVSSASSQTSSTTVTSASGGPSQGQGSNKQGQGALVTGAKGGSRSSTPTSSGNNSGGDSKSGVKTGEKDTLNKGASGQGGQGNQPSGKQKKKNGKKKGKRGGGAGNNGGGADASEEVSESVVEEVVNEGGAVAMKGNSSREIASVEPTEKDTQTLKAENKKLREMQTCKICMDKPVNMTLLPCGHLVCCESCSPHLRKCPICRTRIEGSVKTFMS